MMLCAATQNDAIYMIEMGKGLSAFGPYLEDATSPAARYVDMTLRMAMQSMNPHRFFNPRMNLT